MYKRQVLYDAVFAGVRHFHPCFGGDIFEVRKEAEERGTSMNLFDILGPVMVLSLIHICSGIHDLHGDGSGCHAYVR